MATLVSDARIRSTLETRQPRFILNVLRGQQNTEASYRYLCNGSQSTLVATNNLFAPRNYKYRGRDSGYSKHEQVTARNTARLTGSRVNYTQPVLLVFMKEGRSISQSLFVSILSVITEVTEKWQLIRGGRTAHAQSTSFYEFLRPRVSSEVMYKPFLQKKVNVF